MAATSLFRALAGWPRRAAAAVCLLMALLSTLSGRRPVPASATTVPLPPGLVATTAVVSADAAVFLRVGERIDLVAGPSEVAQGQSTTTAASIVASGVQVLAIRQPSDGVSGSRVVHVLVAARRDVAVQIATRESGEVLAAISAPP